MSVRIVSKGNNPDRGSVSVAILAAGDGTRMRSQRAKPLTKLCGRTMIDYVLSSLTDLENLSRVVVVVGHQENLIRQAVLSQFRRPEVEVVFATQSRRRGTGDALSVALTRLPDALQSDEPQTLVVLPADTPLLRASTLSELVSSHRTSSSAATVLTARVPNPQGYGRVVRDRHGEIDRIVEERDASGEVLLVNEVNTSCYVFDQAVLGPSLRRLLPANAQAEYYLTDVIGILRSAGYQVRGFEVDDFREVSGVNDRLQLAEAEAVLRSRINESWMRRGVTLVDPSSTYIDADVEIGVDTTVWPQTILGGRTVVGPNSEIGPEVRLVDCHLGVGCTVVRCEGNRAYVGDEARVGPYVELRAGAKVEAGARVGPFAVVD
ncbi:MAG: bifunctional UDP-N-acetylglucosamine diphosphorylase/glucosamine-1-phosphate N-acetyltransferase GlmU [Acidimicrobiales bacterium]